MKLGRVVGTVVCTEKVEGLQGKKLLVVQPVWADLSPEGQAFVAADASDQAGTGDLITYEMSREAALCMDPWFVPVDHAIVGIVSQHHYDDSWGHS